MAAGRNIVPRQAEGCDAILAQFGFGPGAANGNVVPPPPAGTAFRFYWNTPFQLSPHNPSTVYLGAERVFKSMDRGNTWVMSDDLTRKIGRNDRPIMEVDGKAPMASKHDGAAAYSNIVTISESPVIPGIVWVGTNDGNVQISRDGGQTFKNVVGKVQTQKSARTTPVPCSILTPVPSRRIALTGVLRTTLGAISR